MTISVAKYVKSGAGAATALENTNAKATKLSEMSLVELLEGLIEACDREIVSNNAKDNA